MSYGGCSWSIQLSQILFIESVLVFSKCCIDIRGFAKDIQLLLNGPLSCHLLYNQIGLARKLHGTWAYWTSGLPCLNDEGIWSDFSKVHVNSTSCCQISSTFQSNLSISLLRCILAERFHSSDSSLQVLYKSPGQVLPTSLQNLSFPL